MSRMRKTDESDGPVDAERAEALAAVRRFRSGWVELAAVLTRVKRDRSFARWGFETFEEYARGELGLRRETVEKLTGSYAFLKRRAPSMVSADAPISKVPNLRAVDFLRRAEEEGELPQRTLDHVRTLVLEEGASVQRIPREVREVVMPVPADERVRRNIAGLRNVATRLRELVRESEDTVPEVLAGRVERVVDDLLKALNRSLAENDAA